MKTIWLVTHAKTEIGTEKMGFNVDPIMGSKAYASLQRLKSTLNQLLKNQSPPEVHCGTGSRQWQVVCALGLDDREVIFSDVWGGPATIVQKENGEKAILLCHGRLIPYERFASIRHMSGMVIGKAIRDLAHNTVICSGRPVLVRLGMKPEECLNGAIYRIWVHNGQIRLKAMTRGIRLLH